MDPNLSEPDRQFKLAAVLPDFQEWIAHFDRLSEQDTESVKRIIYGTHPRQWMEHTRFDSHTQVMPVFIHGGFWRAQKAESYRFIMHSLARRFGAAGNLEYRLMPEVRMSELISDVRTALTQLIIELPEQIELMLIGHSAGGQLALYAREDPVIRERCAAIVSLSGVYDLRPLTQCFLQDEISLARWEVQHYSPILTHRNHLESLLCVVGRDETSAFLEQQRLFAEQVAGVSAQVEGAHHLSILSGFESAQSDLVNAIHCFASLGISPANIRLDTPGINIRS